MRKILIALLTILMMCSFSFAQNSLPELEKLKKIKIFKSTHQDVKKILAEYIDENYDVESDFQWVSGKSGLIVLTFASGNCADDSYWNVSKGLVTSVAISHIEGVKLKDLEIDLKKFKKAIEFKDSPKDINYDDEKSGRLIETSDGEVSRIVFYPPKNKRGFLCTNENTLDILSGEERLADVVSPNIILDIDMSPIINQVTLSETEVFANGKNKIDVKVKATDPEGELLVYDYTVTDGKIIGKGASVVWDLTNVKPGTHTITITIDDGCGNCAEPMTKTIVIR